MTLYFAGNSAGNERNCCFGVPKPLQEGHTMSYPSFHSYIKTLRSLLKRKQRWLLEESTLLADLCLAYGSIAGLSERDKRTLFLAAHFKNLGAIYIDDHCLEQEFRDHSQIVSQMDVLFKESAQLAKDAGLDEVAHVLEQYHLRAIPDYHLARVFQVLNAWVSCRQRKGWRSSMSDKEALIILKQRAEMKWSDPKVVFHFIEHLCRYSSRPERVQACTVSGFETGPDEETLELNSFGVLEQRL
jgi:HD-GYP domain-containing protein (c-di-GMP phosphodiesterase class II)